MTQPTTSPKANPSFRLVLASTSNYRKKLLEYLGLSFVVAAPEYQEEHDLPLSPEKLACTLARKKAQSLCLKFPKALILGCDQLAELNGEILGKPNTEKRARIQLKKLSGRTHRLLTAVCLVDTTTGRREQLLDVHCMTMRKLSARQIQLYVQNDQPFDCAGSYKIEGRGIALFESMKGEDYTGIIGLPLTKVVSLLYKFGIVL